MRSRSRAAWRIAGHQGVAVAVALAALAALTLSSRPARACDYCMPVVGVNPLSWQDYVSIYSHELYLGHYRSGWGAAAHAPDNERDNHLTNDLTISHRLTDRLVLAVDILFPYQYMSVGGSSPNQVSAFGLGDIYLLPSWIAYSSFDSHVILGPVIKAPTGQTNVVDASGGTADPDFQLGSGSWDFGGQIMAQTRLVGGQLAEYFMIKKDLAGRFLAAGPMGTPLLHSYNFEGMQDLIYSHRIAGSQAGAALLLGELGADVGFLGHEIYEGQPDKSADSGGAIYLLAAPGLELILPRHRLSIEAVAQIPAVQYWSGTQLGYSFEAFLGVRYLYR